MPGEILRRPHARLDLIDIWNYIADDNEAAADRMLDRIEGALQMLSEQPKAGRERSELAPGCVASRLETTCCSTCLSQGASTWCAC
jgi:plasmid stabilization system protein ParE